MGRVMVIIDIQCRQVIDQRHRSGVGGFFQKAAGFTGQNDIGIAVYGDVVHTGHYDGFHAEIPHEIQQGDGSMTVAWEQKCQAGISGFDAGDFLRIVQAGRADQTDAAPYLG